MQIIVLLTLSQTIQIGPAYPPYDGGALSTPPGKMNVSHIQCLGNLLCGKDGGLLQMSYTFDGGAVSATELAADPSDCSAGQYAHTIAANGNLTCSQVTGGQISGAVATATALDADPSDCSTNQYATAINASGALTCTQVTTAQLSGTITDGQLANNYSGVGACSANTFASTLNDNAAPTCTQPAFSNLSGSATIAQGGTTETASTEDAVLVGASTTDWVPKVLPACTDTGGNHLNYDQATNAFSCGSTSSGGGGGAPVDGGYLTWEAGSTGSFRERVLSAGDYTVIDNATAGQTQVDWVHGLTCSAGQALTSSGTSAMACTSTITASDVVCAGACVSSAEIVSVSGGQVSSAVATATSLAGDPADCAANQYANAINASGTLTCSQVTTTQLSGTISDAQLANNYSGVGACGANTFASTLNDNAAPTCTQPAFSNLSGTAGIAQGGTTETASTEDAVLVGAGTTDWAPKVLPACTDTGGNHLNYDQATNAFSCGTSSATSGASFVTSVAETSLSNEFALGTLATGVLINTTTTGIPTIKGSNTCTNQFPRSDNASGTWTCASIATADLPVIDISKGGTTETASTEDAVLVGAGTTDWAPKVLPSCSNGTTDKLLYNSTTNAFSCGSDQTGGAGTGKSFEQSVSLTDTGYFTQAVTLASTTATDKFVCRPFGTTADGLTPEVIGIAQLQATVSDLNPGVGLNVNVYNPSGLVGTVRIHCTTGG